MAGSFLLEILGFFQKRKYDYKQLSITNSFKLLKEYLYARSPFLRSERISD